MVQREDWGEKKQESQWCRWKVRETGTFVEGNGQTQKMFRTNELTTVLLRVRLREERTHGLTLRFLAQRLGDYCFPGSELQPQEAGMMGKRLSMLLMLEGKAAHESYWAARLQTCPGDSGEP